MISAIPGSDRITQRTRTASLHERGRAAYTEVARGDTRRHGNLLISAAESWGQRARGTLWTDGVRHTRNGIVFDEDWAEFGAAFKEYAATKVLKKGDGAWFTPAISTNGRCRDVDISSITQIGLDADGVGDWHALMSVGSSASLAFIAQRSSSHRPDNPKFHVFLPLSAPWFGSKLEWRATYRHLVAVFSAIGQLTVDLDAATPSYGFDHATDRLGQPFFFSTRRTADGPIPETVISSGYALSLPKLLSVTHFEPFVETTSAIRTDARLRNARRKGRCPEFFLLAAFRSAGWLGPAVGQTATAVRCPWYDLHTYGDPYNSSTVLFAPSTKSTRGWFHCAHAHCRGRTQLEVMQALPPSALTAAIRAENCGAFHAR